MMLLIALLNSSSEHALSLDWTIEEATRIFHDEAMKVSRMFFFCLIKKSNLFEKIKASG